MKQIEPGCLAYVTYSIRKPRLAWTRCRVIAPCPEGAPTVLGEPTISGDWDCDHPDVPGIAVIHEKQLMRIDGYDGYDGIEETTEQDKELTV